MEPRTTWSMPRWCSRCTRSITVRVEMQTPMPERDPHRARWVDAAIRECEAVFQETHAATCGRTK